VARRQVPGSVEARLLEHILLTLWVRD